MKKGRITRGTDAAISGKKKEPGTIATRSLGGIMGSDDVSLSGGTATFASKSVGSAKTVTATGLSLGGADPANYQLAASTATTTADITARALVVSATGVNKSYDGNSTATVTLSDNRVAGDTLSRSYTSASFANKNVGPAKSVSVSGIAISGTDAANYTANPTASTTADITARSLTVSATGSLPMTYQWQRNGQDLAGAMNVHRSNVQLQYGNAALSSSAAHGLLVNGRTLERCSKSPRYLVPASKAPMSSE